MDAEIIKDANYLDISRWLESEGITREVCQKFEENEIDGACFLELTEEDIRSIVPKIGVIKKIKRIQATIAANFPIDHQHEDQSSFLDASSSSMLSPTSPSPYPFSPPSDHDDSVSLSSASSLNTPKFVIPDTWRPSIMACLNSTDEEQQNKLLTVSIRGEIVRDMVTQMYSINPKPDRNLCTLVAKKLVHKYNFLADVDKNGKPAGYGSWEKKMIERVQNVNSRKRNASGPAEGSLTPKRGRPKSSNVRLYPDIPVINNDDESLESDNIALKKELELAKPRKEVVLSLMRKTYTHRREYILATKDRMSMNELISMYQGYTYCYCIEQEMDLILQKKDVVKNACHEWRTKWVPAILMYCDQQSGKMLESYTEEKTNYADDDECDDKVAMTLAIKLISRKCIRTPLIYVYEEFKSNENIDDVICKSPSRPAPRIIYSGTYFLVVENNILFETNTCSKALMYCFSLYYVFNMEYSKEVREFLMFLQEFVFGQPEKKKKGSTYQTVTSDFAKFLTFV